MSLVRQFCFGSSTPACSYTTASQRPRSFSAPDLVGLEFLPEEEDDKAEASSDSEKSAESPVSSSTVQFSRGICSLLFGDFFFDLNQSLVIKSKAESFVRQLTRMHLEMAQQSPWDLALLPRNMTQSIENLMRQQIEFKHNGKDSRVDIGFHYSQSRSLHSIQNHGLLTRAERRARGVQSCSNNRSMYGDGVYTADEPYSYHNFAVPAGKGPGILVLRLLGHVELCFASEIKQDENQDCWFARADTIRARKIRDQDAVVLRKSNQSVALMHFPSDMVLLTNDHAVGNQLLHHYHVRLQELVDQVFNNGHRTNVPQRLPSDRRQALLPFVGRGIQRYVRQFSPLNPSKDGEPPAQFETQLRYSDARTVSSSSGAATDWTTLTQLGSVNGNIRARPGCHFSSRRTENCSVCLSSLLQGPVFSLTDCGHVFHRVCLERALRHAKRCPNCRNPVGELQGSMPSGVMNIFNSARTTCSGYGNDTSTSGTIIIHYHLFGGYQRDHHPNPGTAYEPTQRHAYLPDNVDGRRLLKRLKYAFTHGLTFTVGTSLTTGRSNVIVWASIHHKTYPWPGPHGYPDPGYFVNCNEDLDALGVPPAHDLH